MKPLYTNTDFSSAKSQDKLPCQCYECKKNFYLTKHIIQRALNPNNKTQGKFCSQKCAHKHVSKHSSVVCENCKKSFFKAQAEIKNSKNHFCSRSCNITYNNTHKTHGTRRSKLEIYIEKQLTSTYPNLIIDFNKKDTINSELDIYIPSLKLAFELNGIFHYEPIFGQVKLLQIQNNDQRKFQACLEKQIELVLIDSSSLKYFKEERAAKFISIITEIINSKNYLDS